MIRSQPSEMSGRTSAGLRAAAVMSLVSGLGFGAGAVVTLAYLARDGELPMTPWGFRSMAGPFERLGPGLFSALAWVLVGVCILDVLAGIWLWQGRRRGARLGLATAPLAGGLGAGFALPFLLIGVPVKVILILTGRRGPQIARAVAILVRPMNAREP